MLREILPGLRAVAILANIGNPNSMLEMGEAHAAAHTLGPDVVTSEIRRAEDIAPVFEAQAASAPDPASDDQSGFESTRWHWA